MENELEMAMAAKKRRIGRLRLSLKEALELKIK